MNATRRGPIDALAWSTRSGLRDPFVLRVVRRLERKCVRQLRRHRSSQMNVVEPRDILNLFELRESLERRAVQRAAVARDRDLRLARLVVSALDEVAARPDLAMWNQLEVRFHRAVHDQGGNTLLASLTEETHLKVQRRCAFCLEAPTYRPDALRLLQVHHYTLLDAVEAGDVRVAAYQAKAHIQFVRDVILALLDGDPVGTGAKSSRVVTVFPALSPGEDLLEAEGGF